jgi:hypothetical protein
MQLLDEYVAFEERGHIWWPWWAPSISRIITTAFIIHGPFSYEIAGLKGSDIIHATFQPLR